MLNSSYDDDDDDDDGEDTNSALSFLRKKLRSINEDINPSENTVDIEIEHDSWSEKVLNVLRLIQTSANCDATQAMLLSGIVNEVPEEDRKIIVDIEKSINMSINFPSDYKLIKDQYTNELFDLLNNIDIQAARLKNEDNRNVILSLVKHIKKCYELAILNAISRSRLV